MKGVKARFKGQPARGGRQQREQTDRPIMLSLLLLLLQ